MGSTAARAARKVRAGVRRLRSPRPVVVSVLLPIYNVEEYLDECLDSIREQTHTALQIVVVDDGSPDGSRTIAERHASQDRRIVIVSQPNAGLGAARNTALEHASGTYVCFVDSDDQLPRDGISRLVQSAERSGSDVVVGNLLRFNSRQAWRSPWAVNVHDRDRIRVRVRDFPAVLRNNYTPGKLFRTSFWRESGLWFREGVTYEDQPIITQLYARADTIDVLAADMYRYRQREDTTSISQQTHTLTDLRNRIAAWDISHEILAAEAPDAIYNGWIRTIFETHFHWYLRNTAITADDLYWDELRQAIIRLTADMPVEVWETALPERRVAVELARRGMRSELIEFVRSDGYALREFPAVVGQDGIEIHLPYFDDAEVGIPDRYFRLHSERLDLVHRLDHARWTEDGALHVKGWAYLRYIDLSARDTRITLTVKHNRTGTAISVVADRDPRPYSDGKGDPWADYEPAAFEAIVPVTDLIIQSRRHQVGERWALLVTVETGPFTKTAQVNRLRKAGSVRHLGPHPLDDGFMSTPDLEDHVPFEVQMSRAEVFLERAELHGRTLAGRLTGPAAAFVEQIRLVRTGSSSPVQAVDVTSDDAGYPVFRVTLPTTERIDVHSPAVWQLRAGSDGSDRTVATIDDLIERHPAVDGAHVVRLRQTRRGNVQVHEEVFRPELDTIGLDAGRLLVSGSAIEPSRTVSLYLRSGPTTSTGIDVTAGTDGHFEARVPLTRSFWHFGHLQIPPDTYTLMVSWVEDTGGVVERPVQVTTRLTREFPRHLEEGPVNASVVRGPSRSLSVTVHPPVGPNARGRFRQNRLQTQFPPSRTRDRLDGVLMQSDFGENADCNAAGVHAELRRRDAGIPVYWAITDPSVPVPEGGIPVIRNSARWYELLQTSRYLVDNMFQADYHRKPDGQVIVQTFHGYPFKTMGHPHWRNLGLSQQRIDSYGARSREWDYLVSPARYATPLLRQGFDYHGEVLEIGYPRNDVLQSPQAPAIRDEVRRSLGIEEGVTAVLYAPTFRDYLSAKVNDRNTDLVDFLNYEEFERELGTDHVLLTRAHTFNVRDRHRIWQSPTLIDVTDYPRRADLYLAADAAVLDYSSLRFDFAVTGKPMLFLVPDLDRYQEARGWLVDFEATAPGPLLGSTAEVVDALRNLDQVVAAHSDAYARFAKSYLDLEDGRAAARLVDSVFVPRGDAPPST